MGLLSSYVSASRYHPFNAMRQAAVCLGANSEILSVCMRYGSIVQPTSKTTFSHLAATLMNVLNQLVHFVDPRVFRLILRTIRDLLLGLPYDPPTGWPAARDPTGFTLCSRASGILWVTFSVYTLHTRLPFLLSSGSCLMYTACEWLNSLPFEVSNIWRYAHGSLHIAPNLGRLYGLVESLKCHSICASFIFQHVMSVSQGKGTSDNIVNNSSVAHLACFTQTTSDRVQPSANCHHASFHMQAVLVLAAVRRIDRLGNAAGCLIKTRCTQPVRYIARLLTSVNTGKVYALWNRDLWMGASLIILVVFDLGTCVVFATLAMKEMIYIDMNCFIVDHLPRKMLYLWYVLFLACNESLESLLYQHDRAFRPNMPLDAGVCQIHVFWTWTKP
jgi:hypothetical protein